MKYKVIIKSTNADHDTSQYESATFVDAATMYYPHTQKVLAEYHTSRFMNNKVKITLYDVNGKGWPHEFEKTMDWDRRAWDICVAWLNERGYNERQS